jgi:hypothetical protein
MKEVYLLLYLTHFLLVEDSSTTYLSLGEGLWRCDDERFSFNLLSVATVALKWRLH